MSEQKEQPNEPQTPDEGDGRSPWGSFFSGGPKPESSANTDAWKGLLPLLAGSALALMKMFGVVRGLGKPHVEDDLIRAVEFEEKETREDARRARSDATKIAAQRESSKESLDAYNAMGRRAEGHHKENIEQNNKAQALADVRQREETAAKIFVALLESEDSRGEDVLATDAVRLADLLRSKLASR